jgi:hypothetical protein
MKKAIRLLMAFASLSVANAQARSAVVVSSNGYYGAAWSAFLNAEKAIAKATAICQQKGSVNIKVLVSRNEDPATGMIFCSIAASGRGPAAIAGAGYGTLPAASDGAAFVDCRQKAGTSPHIVIAWKERDSVNGMSPGTRVGKL